MKRVLPEDGYKTVYRVKYENGIVAEPSSLDEVLDGENSGSAAVRQISFTLSEATEEPKIVITAMFSDREATQEWESIWYGIKGQDRDWTFVASSQLAERISRVERFDPTRFVRHRLLSLFLMLLLLGWLMFSLGSMVNFSAERAEALKGLRTQWRQGQLTDLVDALLKVNEADVKISAVHESHRSLPRQIGIPFALVLVIMFGAEPLINVIYKPYVFAWGEALSKYDRRKGWMRFIFGGIVLALLLGVLGNYISKKMGL